MSSVPSVGNFRVSDLPRRPNGRTVRGMRVNPQVILLDRVKMSEGLTLAEAARRVGLTCEQLSSRPRLSEADGAGGTCGGPGIIMGDEIDVAGLREMALASNSILREMPLRAGEKFSPTHAVKVFLGRLGVEKEVLLGFGLVAALRKNPGKKTGRLC